MPVARHVFHFRQIPLVSHYEHQVKSASWLCLSSNINWLDITYNFRDCSFTAHVVIKGSSMCGDDDRLL
jgi:hypothetical protein